MQTENESVFRLIKSLNNINHSGRCVHQATFLYVFSAKIVVHLHQGQPGRPAGPSSSSPHNFIRLSFRESGEAEVSTLPNTLKIYFSSSHFQNLWTYIAAGNSSSKVKQINWLILVSGMC